MREVAFIKQNKEKWLNIEQIIEGKIKKNPDDLSAMYINLTNDLSFSQTYYPKSKTTIYLNYLSSRVFQRIYKTRRIERNRLLYFFKTEVPLLMYDYRRYLLYAFTFFFLFTLVGFLSAYYQPEFMNAFLGDGYVNVTIENIKNGDTMGVYKDGSNWGNAIGIILNNLEVGAYMYLFGIFAGIGTFFSLMMNSVMLGSFQSLFIEYGGLTDSLKGIWLHGTFEIFGMVVEAMAGLVLGASVLFPKTFSRINSLKIGFKDSIKIFLSTVPFTIMAGIIEGFITRYALDMHISINLMIIFGSLLLIGGYYIVYPFIVHRKIKNL